MKKNKIHITYKEVFEAAGMKLPNNAIFLLLVNLNTFIRIT